MEPPICRRTRAGAVRRWQAGQGKNPFAGTLDGFHPGVKSFASRMTEMVIRDMHVQMAESPFIEDVAARKTTSESDVVGKKTSELTVANGLAFVNADNTDPLMAQDGTYEHPYTTVQHGVNAAFISPDLTTTYVMAPCLRRHVWRDRRGSSRGYRVGCGHTHLTVMEASSFGGGTMPSCGCAQSRSDVHNL